MIVFLALNLFLLEQWWTLQTAVGTYQEPYADQLANVKRALAQHHVSVTANVPNVEPILSLLRATHLQDSFDHVAATVLQLPLSQVKAHEVHSQEVILPYATFTENRSGELHLSLQYQAQTVIDSHISALHQIEKWAAIHVYQFTDYRFWGWNHSARGITAVFDEQYQGYPIFHAKLTIMIENGRIIGFRQTYYTVDVTNPSRVVISAANALLAMSLFMDKAHINEDNTVRTVVLGYDSGIQLPKVWFLTPVWRIYTDLGNFEVNAFTGEVGVEKS